MRYPKNAALARRFQIKFHNDADFHRALNILKDLGLLITDSPLSKIRPLASPAPYLSAPDPNWSCEATSGSEASSVTPVPGSNGIYNGLPLNSPAPAKSPLPSLPTSTRTPSLSSSDSSFSVLLSSHQPSSDRSMPPPPVAAPHLSTPHYDPIAARPLSTSALVPKNSLYFGQMDKEIRRISYPEGLEHMIRTGSASPYFLGGNKPFGKLPSMSEDPFTQRQYSMPLYSQSSRSQLWEIPPRRELPFLAKSDPLPKPTVINEAIECSTKGLRADAASEPVKGGSVTPTRKPPRKRVASRKLSIKEVVRPTVNETIKPPFHEAIKPPAKLIVKLPVQVPDNELIAHPLSKGHLVNVPEAAEAVASIPTHRPEPKRAASRILPPARKFNTPEIAETPEATRNDSLSTVASPKLLPHATKKRLTARPASATKRPKVVDSATQTETRSGRHHSSNPSLEMESPPKQYLTAIDSLVSKHRRPRQQEIWEAPGYADGTQEERDAILNDYICENLENANFLQICEDTEHAWRRIGLGM
ncbi:hypothetical protein BJ875DRAFT_449850 [Amylocarpus encephaloides]|uniref:Uncharacterized protein n=1 Tax=Amylocarpus encephaloides TaxID=45428 RepID=A0A9P7YS05_9HELO|nr:hypothetical protein BJ875DRAFT_449850 [Amylocarpus encephaloides]